MLLLTCTDTNTHLQYWCVDYVVIVSKLRAYFSEGPPPVCPLSLSCECVYICYTVSGCLILITDLKIFVHSFLPPLQLVLESEEQQSFTSTVVEDLEKGQSLAPTSPQLLPLFNG